ncbi:hypothetical protein [Sphingomonas sp. VNH70]|uniref:hypothetical protein n=1 Tax=Sphingomonas silueang TaxID=3156617 RepID=UPI0032B3D2BB
MRRIAAALALLACGSAQAQTPASCVTPAEAEALVLFVAPELIRQAGNRCASALPPTALIRRTSGPFLARYEAETAGAWPQAKAALSRLTAPQAIQLLDSSFAAPIVASLIAPMVVGNVDPADCPRIERAATLVQSLPPRNVAGLVVLFAQIDADSPKPQMRLPLCGTRARN